MTVCKTCPKELSKYSKTGHCRQCWPKSESRRDHISQLMKRKWQNPKTRDAYVAAGTKNLQTPGAHEKAIASVKANKTWEIASKAITPEIRAKVAKRRSDEMLAHIPREYRAEYKRLTREARCTAAEASEMIAQQHERDLEQFRRKVQHAVNESRRRSIDEGFIQTIE